MSACSVKQQINIRLFGQTYRFESVYGPHRAQAVRDLLLNEVQRIESHYATQSQHISKFAILVSAALNIANDNIEFKKHESAFLKEIDNRSESILQLLNGE